MKNLLNLLILVGVGSLMVSASNNIEEDANLDVVSVDIRLKHSHH